MHPRRRSSSKEEGDKGGRSQGKVTQVTIISSSRSSVYEYRAGV
jgi:hypothetical protein